MTLTYINLAACILSAYVAGISSSFLSRVVNMVICLANAAIIVVRLGV
jgi:hypothetical protein